MNWVSLAAVIFLGANASALGIRGAGTTDSTKVAKAGDTMTGQLTVSGASVTVSGAGGHIISGSSITASAFFGNGASVTGVTAATNANLTGPVTSVGNATTIAGPVPQAAVNLSTVTTALDLKAPLTGVGTSGTWPITAANVTTNANLTGPVTSVGNATTIAGPVPPAAVDLSTVTTALALKANLAGATFTGASGITNVAFTATGASGNIISAASMTASGFFGDGSALTGLASAEGNTFTSSKTFTAAMESAGFTARGQATVTSTVTVQGNAFSVGGSTLVVTGGNVGIGTASPKVKLNVSGAADVTSPTLGTASGGLLVQGTDAGYGLMAGSSASGPAWIQVQRVDAGATAYSLNLQPSGGNVGIGTVSPGVILDVVSTTQGLGVPSMTSAQVAASTPGRAGAIIYNSTISLPCISTGTAIMAYSRFTGVTTCQ